MCGLLGEISFGESLIEFGRFENLLALSRTRGPDQTRIETFERRLRFGFNRLAILDRSNNAKQPMWSPTKRYLIVFNGEIYNHFDLRRKLSEKGSNIKSHGDTATLASCIDEWGVKKTVNQLDGMFSIGIWDCKKKSISLVRDFAGIKPLFYGFNHSSLVFASQYNQISRHPYFYKEKVDQEVLKLYLSQHFIPSPFGLLKNTHSVFPGEIITFDKNGVKKSVTYWDFPQYDNNNIKKNEALKIVTNELSTAVKSQLISDVPVGAFLSGGVDSPIISYYANSNNFKTFSIGSDSPKHDESYLSKQYAEFLGTIHHSKQMNATNSVEALEKSIYSAGEPIGDFSILPTWEVSRLASKSLSVVLSGDGADELFFGYDRFKSISKNHWLWPYPYQLRYLIRGLDRLVFNDRYINECVLSKNPGLAHFGLQNRFPSKILEKLIPGITNISLPNTYLTYDYVNPKSKDELLHFIRRAEFYGMLQKTLTKVDRASMAHSLEVRVPFLKKTMIENVVKLGVSVHEANKKRKMILFNILKTLFPNIQHEKVKKGFSVPLSAWINNSFKMHFYDTLLEEKFCNSYGIDKKSIEDMLNNHISGNKDLKWSLFTLYSLAIWSREGQRMV